MVKNIVHTILILSSISICSCNRSSDFEIASDSINIGDLESWAKELGSDKFMGRAPFTEGEKITTEYLAGQLKKIGFEPAFKGSYFQEVPMVKFLSTVKEPVTLQSLKTIFEYSTPYDYAGKVAAEQDRYITGDPNSHTGMYFRSDHFSFAKKGVPSLYARGNTDSRQYGKEWTARMERDYIENRYHRPADNYDPEKWNFEGIAEDAELAFSVGYRLATSDIFPQWRPVSEFKGIRK
jgi:hypothetical protein